MKSKKFLTLALSAMAMASVFAFSGCDFLPDDGGVTPGGKTEYVMEAEYIDLYNVSGAGISSNQSGLQMIYGSGSQAEKDKGWSNGYYIGFTHTSQCVLTFNFTADKADDAAVLVFRLGSELSRMTMTPNDVSITLNGKVMPYGSFTINGSNGQMNEVQFKDYTVSSSASLVEGKNTVTLEVKDNNLRGNGVGGPMVDCLKVTSSSTLTFEAHETNLTEKDEI